MNRTPSSIPQISAIAKYFFYFIFIIVSISCYNRTTSTDLDFKVFHQATVRVVHHQADLYDFKRDKIFTYKYSPVFPLLTYPMGHLTMVTAKKIWAIDNFIALPLAWYFLTQIFLILSKTTEINYLNHLITLLLLAQPITNNATQGNINTILLTFLAAAFYFSIKNKKYFAGFFAAIGFSIKLTPGVVFIYFLVYQKWKELLIAILTSFILLILVPVLYFGMHQTIDLYLGWKTVLSDTSHFPFYKYTNQSPLVIMTHLQSLESVNVISKIFYYAVNLVMAASLWYFYKRKNELVFICFSFILLLTAAPVVWMEYYLFLVLPYFVIHQKLVTNTLSKSSKILWCLKLVIAHLMVKFLIGNHLSDLMTYYGRSFIGLIIIFVIFYLEERRQMTPAYS
jgi:hypothetical protein